MLTWISENAKWVIYIFIIGIVAGLLFMDTGSLRTDNRPPVGVVNGEKISYDLFERSLRQNQGQQAGHSDERTVQNRNELFRSFVRQHLKQKLIADMKITASAHEMEGDLRTDRPESVYREPMFQTNGVFDSTKYEAWLNDPATYNIPFMQYYENLLKVEKIPEKQLRVFIGAGVHPSTLEAKYRILNRETKFELLNAQGDAYAFEDFPVSQSSIDSVFKAEPDSFFVPKDLAKVRYIAIPLEPGIQDAERVHENAKRLLAQIKKGDYDFAEMAKSDSDDFDSAEQGGELGYYAPRGRWGTEFDSTVLALDSGEVSDPVRTQFGYHIIQNLGKRIENGEEQVKARHILIKIDMSQETKDSLEVVLKGVKEDVDAGKSFEEAAKNRRLESKLSGWFARVSETPEGSHAEHGYIAGLSSIPELGYIEGLSYYAFFNSLRPKEDSKTSEVLQNSKWIAIFEKADGLSAGSRSLDFAGPKIEQNLKKKTKVNAIAEHLKANIDKIAAITVLDSASRTSIEKVAIDSTSVTFVDYLPGLGFANPELYKALSLAKEGEWSGPYTSDQSAVLIKVLKKSSPSEEELKTAIESELAVIWQYSTFEAFGHYIRSLEAGAKIVNNLNYYYTE